MNLLIVGMIYAGSALMVVNIYQYIKYAKFVQREGIWTKEMTILYTPIILLVLFLVGYLCVAIFGKPDIIMAAILLGGSIFVFVVFLLLQRVTSMIQERGRLEAQLIAAEESSRLKTSFLSSMSHEMRTPMNAIIGINTIALKNPNLPDDTRAQFEKIDVSAKHLLAMINNILEISNYTTEKTELKEDQIQIMADLKSINMLIQAKCRSKNLEYSFQVIGELDDYYIGDEMKLRQILLSVLDNAVKFTEPPGKVAFTVEQIEADDNDRKLRFVVSDTGIGISEKFLPMIYETFSQEDDTVRARYGGSGLGLAIARHDTEQMHGSITVVSKKGQGSTFTITLTLKKSDKKVDDLKKEIEDGELAMAAVADGTAAGTPEVSGGQGAADGLGTAGAAGAASVSGAAGSPGAAGVLGTTEVAGAAGSSGAAGVLGTAEVAGAAGVKGAAGAATADGDKAAAGATTTGTAEEIESGSQDQLSGANSKEASVSFAEAGLQTPESFSLEGKHVLIVEDIELNAEILEDLLDLEDVTAEVAENGQIAVEMFSSNPPGHFDAILMDLRMPIMDGLEATRVIRALDREDAKTIPIIALTANAFEEDRRNALASGMDVFLSKPVDSDLLVDILKDTFAEK